MQIISVIKKTKRLVKSRLHRTVGSWQLPRLSCSKKPRRSIA